ncbi:MAG TPA: protein-methionine-sulfoxide reductase catalytic subunit MsrP [Vicinamibacterales bacterium]|jgi:sulfoxide reductase catalytic subunit YedY|nr:protein-methionine-sulfoxide reductase catalytic subunit MsrP [Vicinamibacterales bacterium]HVZ20446.1 protein-methionine-sulfoxide reductase catalytic subunit MsrP [Vicinamibacterales bacterium]
MILKTRTSADLPWSEVTPEPIYRSRREFLRTGVAGITGAAVAALAACGTAEVAEAQTTLASTPNPKYVATAADTLNTFEQITTYNNFYEFGSEKGDPAKYAGKLTVKPWSVKVDGMVSKPGTYGVEDLVDFKALEERVYRHRCVEAWSMVIPWIGVPLASVLNKVGPMPSATFVEFTTLERPSEMPGQRTNILQWPYVEGLRMDEAMHPLAFMVIGLYGKVLPNQNGAPLRIHVPWKYGFKSGKSIVRIRFTSRQPLNTWQIAAPNEYGFYANVNPNVPHPRWSQAHERRLPNFFSNTPTQMFNGYGDQVASLYTGMDLKKNF